jgi:hypothetical protein
VKIHRAGQASVDNTGHLGSSCLVQARKPSRSGLDESTLTDQQSLCMHTVTHSSCAKGTTGHPLCTAAGVRYLDTCFVVIALDVLA